MSGGDIEIAVFAESLADRYLISPNALHRGDDDKALGVSFQGMTLRERALLAALLTMKSGYRCSRQRIDRLAPELGRAAVDTVLRGLRNRGHLRQTRTNDPETGKFVWRWDVSFRPVFAGQTMPQLQGGGNETDDWDGTIHGSAIHGSSVDGSPINGSSAPHREEELVVEKNQDLEPPPPQPETLTDQPPIEPVEVVVPTLEQTETAEIVLADAYRLASVPKARQPRGANAAELAGLVVNALDAGWSPKLLAGILGERYDSASTVFGAARWRLQPENLGTLPAPDVPAPARAPCRRGHRGQFEGSCGPCRSEQVGDDAVDPVRVVSAVPSRSRHAMFSAAKSA